MKLKDIITKDYIIYEMKSNTKDDLIEEMINTLSKNPKIKNPSKLRDAIFQRENILSTGIGNGLAIPHCKIKEVEGIVAAFGRKSSGVHFESADNQPVNLIFMIASNENLNTAHLKLLNKLGKLSVDKDFLQSIYSSKNEEEIISIIYDFDLKLSSERKK